MIPELEAIGQLVYETRAAYLVEQNIGLTLYYNRLKDPTNRDPEVLRHRHLHEAMDRAVLRAYGWHDLAQRVPPFDATDEQWSAEIVDRLHVLNHERWKQEQGVAGDLDAIA